MSLNEYGKLVLFGVALAFIVLFSALLGVQAANAGEPTYAENTHCFVGEEPGLFNGEVCVTEAMYNSLYEDPFAEFDIVQFMGGAMQDVKAEDYFEPQPSTTPAERPREFMGEELPTYQEIMFLIKFAGLV